MSNKKPSFIKRSHKGNALIITISILFLATAQMLFMGLVTSSTSTDEGLLVGQNAEVKDALNLGFVDLENRINMALNVGVTPATITTNFRLDGPCMPSYRRDPANLATILPSSAAACPHAGGTLQGMLGIEAVRPDPTGPTTKPMIRAVQPPLDKYTDIRVYVASRTGKLYTLEGRVQGHGLNLTTQKQILLD